MLMTFILKQDNRTLRHEGSYTHTILGNCSFAIRRGYFFSTVSV